MRYTGLFVLEELTVKVTKQLTNSKGLIPAALHVVKSMRVSQFVSQIGIGHTRYCILFALFLAAF